MFDLFRAMSLLLDRWRPPGRAPRADQRPLAARSARLSPPNGLNRSRGLRATSRPRIGRTFSGSSTTCTRTGSSHSRRTRITGGRTSWAGPTGEGGRSTPPWTCRRLGWYELAHGLLVKDIGTVRRVVTALRMKLEG